MDLDQKPSIIDRERDRDRNRRSDRGGGGGGGRFNNMDDKDNRSRDRSTSSRIYVSNVPYEFRWQDLKDLFRREVGDVVFVELFNDENNKPRGCGIVEFEKAEMVQKALEKMNRHNLNGRNLVIKEDFGNERDKYGRVVPKATQNNISNSNNNSNLNQNNNSNNNNNINYNRRDNRDDDRMSAPNMNDYSLHDQQFNTYGLSTKFLEGLGIQGPLHTKVFVANLDYKVDSKKLKQVFKLAGKIVNLELSLDKEGNSRGFAVIEYDHPVEAVQSISMFDRQILYDRRMTVRLDRVPEKSEGLKLPEGLKGIGIGLGPNGEPLRDVARNLPTLQQGGNNQNNNSVLQQQQQQNSVPAPVAPPLSGSLLGPVPNNSLSGLSSNLAALSNVVGLSGLSGLSSGALSNPLLSTAANLSSLGLGLGSNDLQNSANSNNSNYQNAPQNAYSTSSFNTNNNRSDYDLNAANNSVRNYSTQPNDDYNRGYSSLNLGSLNNGGGTGRQNNNQNNQNNKISDTIVIRNLPSSWTWQTLRDKFRDVGEVKFAEIRGQDTGVVRFAKERDAEVAIKLMDGSRYEGRSIDVTFF